MKKLTLRISTGFSDSQQFSIDMSEAHKAYFLFRNPEKRGVFNNGIAIIGRDIRTIQPDWHATMGYLPTHKLDSEDWNEISATAKERMDYAMKKANEVSYLIESNPQLMMAPLEEAVKLLPVNSRNSEDLIDGTAKKLLA